MYLYRILYKGIQMLHCLLHVGKCFIFYAMYSQSKKKKWNTQINFNTNYHREMKLVQINLDYCLLQFDALKLLLAVRLHGEGVLYPTLIFFQCKLSNLTTKS